MIASRALPDLVAELTLYPTDQGGLTNPVSDGVGFPCRPIDARDKHCWDARLLLDAPMHPGETRVVGFRFLSGQDAAAHMRRAGRFILWRMRDVGEARVVEEG